MAVKELTDYLENGNIKNSVNFPSCDMGMCQAESRVAVLHMNIPNMIGQITAILAEQGMNISDMTNKSRDKYAYTLLDLEHKAEESTIQKAQGAIKGVLRVRVVKVTARFRGRTVTLDKQERKDGSCKTIYLCQAVGG